MKSVVYLIMVFAFIIGCDPSSQGDPIDINKDISALSWQLTVKSEGLTSWQYTDTIVIHSKNKTFDYESVEVPMLPPPAETKIAKWSVTLFNDDIYLLDLLVKDADLSNQGDIGADLDPCPGGISYEGISFVSDTGVENSFYISSGAFCADKIPEDIGALIGEISLLRDKYEKISASKNLKSALSLILR